ncbi:thiopurine S-methyltransferase [Candidatus Sororendozoicomonas aggregata]|uniref:thiopurine S-methyltransferase n=1 Tax=Candidatus Sororendozoicomonas aggregata TaxID=3073239 RepID=UPI002ED4B454
MMETAFWLDRWENQQIGFHQNTVNEHLKQHWQSISPGTDNVLIPLCGKSLDILWLAEQSLAVTGIELSALAVDDFFAQSQCEYTVQTLPEYRLYQSQRIRIIQGDYFTLPPELTGKISSFYDRAALIAMPESMRVSYVEKLASLLPSYAQGLLITIEYPQHEFSNPPPFSINTHQVESLLSPYFSVERLSREDTLKNNKKFAGKVSWLYESVYKLIRK